MATSAQNGLDILRKTASLIANLSAPKLVRQGATKLNIFVTFTHLTQEDQDAAIEFARTTTSDCKSYYSRGDASSIKENYSADYRNYSFDHKGQGGAGRPARLDFNQQQHPDDACKMVLSMAIHLDHIITESKLNRAMELTHKKVKGYNGKNLKVWMSNQKKRLPSKVFDFLIPRIKKLAAHTGGIAQMLKAGRNGRLVLWYNHFDEFPFILSKYAFAYTDDVWDLESLHGSPSDDPAVEELTAKCCAFDRYVWGEACEEAFYFIRDGESELAKIVLNVAFRSMTNMNQPFIAELKLPEWTELPCKIYLENSGKVVDELKPPAFGVVKVGPATKRKADNKVKLGKAGKKLRVGQ